MFNNIKIISGGQSGVDRAALDFALKYGVNCGGQCPKGRIAEDGVINPKYPLQEVNSTEYSIRTEQNILHSDATLIIYCNQMDKGTITTLEFAKTHKKPFLVIDTCKEADIDMVRSWMLNPDFKILNIAGPRESNSPGIYNACFELLERISTSFTS